MRLTANMNKALLEQQTNNRYTESNNDNAVKKKENMSQLLFYFINLSDDTGTN
jgi:hypothetical protein